MKRIVLFLMVSGSMVTSCSSADFYHLKKIEPQSESFLSLEHAFQKPHYSAMEITLLYERFLVDEGELVGMVEIVKVIDRVYKRFDTIFFLRKSYDYEKKTEDPEWYKIKNLNQLKKLQQYGIMLVQSFSK